MEAIIQTAAAECQDCYRCVRECPVKAIRVQDAAAQIVDERCIKCGHCVSVCPASAKRVRADLPQVQGWLATAKPVYVSLAPAWVAAFPEMAAGEMIATLMAMGFAGVSETALGAQEVSAHSAQLLNEKKQEVWLSSACPAAAQWAQQYGAADSLVTPLLSPLLTHCRLLRQEIGEHIRVVFFGPCVAKKVEADAHPELLDAALTFDDLHSLLDEQPPIAAGHEAAFVLNRASDGALYPIEGGMLAGLRDACPIADDQLHAVSGMQAVGEAVRDAKAGAVHGFVEVLACAGGCVNGPCMGRHGGGTLARRHRVVSTAPQPQETIPRQPQIMIEDSAHLSGMVYEEPDEASIQAALESVGKYQASDEFNCSGCGYESCQELARAICAGLAESKMCVSYMRQLAQNKANTLLRSMPSGAVLVDQNLRIVEANPAFADLFPEAQEAWQRNPGLPGVSLKGLMPGVPLFRHVLLEGEEIRARDVREGDRVLNISVFPIESERLVAGIIRDITAPAVEREEIVRRARLVVEKQMETVQQIACLLGENAAESEVILGSMADALEIGEEQSNASIT